MIRGWQSGVSMMVLFVMSSLQTWGHANELTPIKADDLDVYQIARAMSIDLRAWYSV